jgi:hypothetical protein
MPSPLVLHLSLLLSSIAFGAVGCQLDERDLEAEPKNNSPVGGRSNENVELVPNPRATTNPDDAPEPEGEEDTPAADCPDLDKNGVQDSDETELANFGFDEDERDWQIDSAVTLQWDERDACGDSGSGSLSLRNDTESGSSANSFVGVTQCLDTAPGEEFVVAAQVWIPKNQGTGSAGINLQFFDTADCNGLPIEQRNGLSAVEEQWTSVHVLIAAPSETLSVKVRVGAVKAFNAEPFEAYVDNVLLRTE